MTKINNCERFQEEAGKMNKDIMHEKKQKVDQLATLMVSWLACGVSDNTLQIPFSVFPVFQDLLPDLSVFTFGKGPPQHSADLLWGPWSVAAAATHVLMEYKTVSSIPGGDSFLGDKVSRPSSSAPWHYYSMTQCMTQGSILCISPYPPSLLTTFTFRSWSCPSPAALLGWFTWSDPRVDLPGQLTWQCPWFSWVTCCWLIRTTILNWLACSTSNACLHV